MLGHLEDVKGVVRVNYLRELMWLYFVITFGVSLINPELGILMIWGLICFIGGKYMVAGSPEPETFAVKAPWESNYADALKKVKVLKALTSKLGCDIMWLYKEAIVRRLTLEADQNEGMVDCEMLKEDRVMLEDKKYTGMLMDRLDAVGIGQTKGANYVDEIQTMLSDLMNMVYVTCPEGKKMPLDQAVKLVEGIFGTFCNKRDEELMNPDGVADLWKQYASDPDKYPLGITRIESPEKYMLADDFEASDLTDSIAAKVKEWVRTPVAEGGLGVSEWGDDAPYTGVKEWIGNHFVGTNAATYKVSYDKWLGVQ